MEATVHEAVSSVMGLIDHAVLHPALTDAEAERGVAVAAQCGVAAACVKPCHVGLAKRILDGSKVLVAAVVGFPHGGSCPETKVEEAALALRNGAEEVDAVINVGKVLSEDWEYVRREVQALNRTVTAQRGLLKVILETAFLEDRHKIELCQIASVCRVAFVKTSTGFDFLRQPDGSSRTRGATDDDIQLMVRSVSSGVKVKASGGLASLDAVLRAHRLGAARIGTSATQTIYQEAVSRAGAAR